MHVHCGKGVCERGRCRERCGWRRPAARGGFLRECGPPPPFRHILFRTGVRDRDGRDAGSSMPGPVAAAAKPLRCLQQYSNSAHSKLRVHPQGSRTRAWLPARPPPPALSLTRPDHLVRVSGSALLRRGSRAAPSRPARSRHQPRARRESSKGERARPLQLPSAAQPCRRSAASWRPRLRWLIRSRRSSNTRQCCRAWSRRPRWRRPSSSSTTVSAPRSRAPPPAAIAARGPDQPAPHAPAVLSDDVPLTASRQLLVQFAQDISKLPADVHKPIAT